MSLMTSKLRIFKALDKYEKYILFADLFYLLKDHKNPVHFCDTRKDYMDLKRNYSFLKAFANRNSGKKVLIVSLTNFIYQVKLEGMLAKTLQSSGCDVMVLTWRHFFWPKKYFKLFGLKKIVYFEDYLNKFKNNDFENEAKFFLKGNLNFQEIKKWRYEGCRLGQQVLATMGRRMFGNPDLANEKTYGLFIYFLSRQIKSIFGAENLLEELNPDLLIFNEANDSIYGAIFDLAFNKGMDVIQFVQPFRDDALVFKRFDKESKGLHPNSLSKSTFEKIKDLSWSMRHEELLRREFESRYKGKWFLSQRNQMGKLIKERSQIVEQIGLDNNKKTVIVFSHILWDANLFYGDDLFEDYEDWFIETAKAACANERVNWIIKMHPSNIWKRNRENVRGQLREVALIREKIGKLPNHVFLLYPETDINTFSLFDLADYGITVRGTVGMELPCFGKPVFTAGTGRYSGLGFTIDSATKDEYLDKLSRIESFPALSQEEVLLAKKHAYAVFNLRPWEMKSFQARFNYKKRGVHPLDHNLTPCINSLEDLIGAEDLKKFSNWALNSKVSDYLEE